jgi:transcriptional regulator with XRE-family HTH domain
VEDPLMQPTTLAKRLRESRFANHLLVSEVAQYLGYRFNIVSALEKGTAVPTVPELVRLAALYGVSIDWLVGLSVAPQPILNAQAAPLILGIIDRQIDRKGRLCVPSKWLRSWNGPIVAVQRSDYAELWDLHTWRRIYPNCSPDWELPVQHQNRALLPATLRRALQIYPGSTAYLCGAGSHARLGKSRGLVVPEVAL